jgi:hypothetical protein
MIAAKVAIMRQGERPVSQTKAAELMNVGIASVQWAGASV